MAVQGEGGLYRIITRNVTGPADTILAHDIGHEIASNPVAYRAYHQLQKAGWDVFLDFAIPGVPDATGRTSWQGVTIYMRNVNSLDEAVATLLHESSHAIRLERRVTSVFSGRPGGYSQMEEYRAFRREFLYSQARRPSLTERQAIFQNIANDRYYGQLPAGNIPPALLP